LGPHSLRHAAVHNVRSAHRRPPLRSRPTDLYAGEASRAWRTPESAADMVSSRRRALMYARSRCTANLRVDQLAAALCASLPRPAGGRQLGINKFLPSTTPTMPIRFCTKN
jgi:hypothetical protein